MSKPIGRINGRRAAQRLGLEIEGYWLQHHKNDKAGTGNYYTAFNEDCRVVLRSTGTNDFEVALNCLRTLVSVRLGKGVLQQQDPPIALVLVRVLQEAFTDHHSFEAIKIAVRHFLAFLDIKIKAGDLPEEPRAEDITPHFLRSFYEWRKGPHEYEVME